ncbi:hypothetical protein IWZ01DRAFT_341204 [Phyllosticta capitalensis]
MCRTERPPPSQACIRAVETIVQAELQRWTRPGCALSGWAVLPAESHPMRSLRLPLAHPFAAASKLGRALALEHATNTRNRAVRQGYISFRLWLKHCACVATCPPSCSSLALHFCLRPTETLSWEHGVSGQHRQHSTGQDCARQPCQDDSSSSSVVKTRRRRSKQATSSVAACRLADATTGAETVGMPGRWVAPWSALSLPRTALCRVTLEIAKSLGSGPEIAMEGIA